MSLYAKIQKFLLVLQQSPQRLCSFRETHKYTFPLSTTASWWLFRLLSVCLSLKKQSDKQQGQNGDSQYCCALVIPLLICSYVTNITMFQDPSRRKEGMNLKGAKEQQVRGVPNMFLLLLLLSLYICMCLPFIESCGSLVSQHSESTVDSTAVLSRPWIHEPCFDYVHRRSHHCCAEAGTKGSSEVTRQVVCSWIETKSHPSTLFFVCLQMCKNLD